MTGESTRQPALSHSGAPLAPHPPTKKKKKKEAPTSSAVVWDNFSSKSNISILYAIFINYILVFSLVHTECTVYGKPRAAIF